MARVEARTSARATMWWHTQGASSDVLYCTRRPACVAEDHGIVRTLTLTGRVMWWCARHALGRVVVVVIALAAESLCRSPVSRARVSGLVVPRRVRLR